MTKKPYEKPAASSEPVYEALMAGCTMPIDELGCSYAGPPFNLS